jgi:N-acetylneuraminic acid mutarotase
LLIVSPCGTDVYNDLYRFDIYTLQWTVLDARSAPAPRSGHGLAFAGDILYVYGGNGMYGSVFGDLHQLELKESTWLQIGTSESAPPARFYAGIVSAAGNLYLFGGLSEQFSEYQAGIVDENTPHDEET